MLLSFRKLFARAKKRNGFALVLVLAFVVLLTGISLAFLSNSLLQRQVSNSSANIAKADLLAQGAVDTTIGDLKAEIAAGSTAVPIVTGGVTTTIYAPKSNTGQSYAQNQGAYTTMLPATQGFTRATYAPGTPDPLANLVKVSTNAPFYQGSVYGGSGPTRAAANSPTTSGNRPMTLARWNAPLFLAAKSTTDSTPTATTFPTPNWIYVSSNGGNPQAPDTSVVGRYAYAIYDEGGLLDVNVAGYPNAMNPPTVAMPDAAYKGAEAYADLTKIGLTQPLIDQIVNWRNQATLSVPNNIGYQTYVAANTKGFLTTDSVGFTSGGATALPGGVSDRMFVGRQQFIDFLKKTTGFNQQAQDALQFLTTFSRDHNQPSYIRLQATNAGSALDYNANVPQVLPPANGGNYYQPATPTQGHDDQVNPSFPSVRVTGTFTRNDGTTAVVGEPLVKTRFALNRLAWLTYRGPSSTRSQGDPDIQALINNGIPWEYLQKGTPENIRRYFGLQWNGTQWTYSNDHAGTAGPIHDIVDLTGTRDPDFFELLKATINVGSIGKALVPPNNSVPADAGAANTDQPFNYNYHSEASVDFQIIQIGANIISQFQTANYPPQILFNNGSFFPKTIVGVANLPYLANIMTGVLQVTPPNPLPRRTKTDVPPFNSGAPGSGGDGDSGYREAQPDQPGKPGSGHPADSLSSTGVGVLMQMPIIWNPHDPSSSTGAVGPTQFRVIADSTTPDQLSGPHASYFVYAASLLHSIQWTEPSDHTQKRLADDYSYDASSGASWYKDPSGGANIAHTFSPSNTEIDFQVTAPSPTHRTLFPEPTMLVRPGLITDLNHNGIQVSVPSSALLYTDPAVSGLQAGGGLPNYFANALNMQAAETRDPANTSYLGFYLGAFPMAWIPPSTSNAPIVSAAQSGCVLAKVTGTKGGSSNSCYFTYQMQYQDSSGNWVTYDTKYGKVTNGSTTFGLKSPSLICGNGGGEGFWAMSTDPRTSRFGLLWNGTVGARGLNTPEGSAVIALPLPGMEFATAHYGGPMTYAAGWLDTANGAIYSIRADAQAGFFSMAGWPSTLPVFDLNSSQYGSTGWMAAICGWGNNNKFPGLCPGLLSQNNTDIRYAESAYWGQGQGGAPEPPNYFADADGIVRRAMGAFVPQGTGSSPAANPGEMGTQKLPSADTTTGLPMARVFNWSGPQVPPSPCPTETNYSSPTQITSQAQSRPYFLHRPFRSVAELGCIFSDTPWRNLDFSTAESGSAALLDTFCIDDDSSTLIAGRVNLNTRQETVLQAILAGGCIDLAQPQSAHATGRIDPTTALQLAQALISRTTNTTPAGAGPLVNVSDIVGRFVRKTAIQQVATPLGQVVPPLAAGMFSDGKLSYTGFSGGTWDTGTHWPQLNTPPVDIYSAYRKSGTFSTNSNHNGTQESMCYIQRFREAPIRALAAAGQTRVWNLMLDVVAQSGKFPATAASFNNFAVQGERRYWVHLAVDRLTGEVLDKQVEVVKE